MYEKFRGELAYKLQDFEPPTLARVLEALDVVASNCTIAKQSTEISVIGRDRFLEIAATYIVVRKTEGLAQGSLDQMIRVLKKFVIAVPKPIETIKPNDIRAYLYRYQQDRNVSNRTLDFMRTIVCTFFKWCAAEGYIPVDPASNIRPIKYIRTPRKALTQRELEIVRRCCKNERDRALVETLYSTGCRVSEICNVRLADVDWVKHSIIVLGKGNKYRTVYLNAKAEVALEAYLNKRKHSSEWLFCNVRGGTQMSKGNVERIFAEIEEKTGIFVTPHIMRHTFATQALTGTGVEVVQQLLGHANIATTMIYADVDRSRLQEAHIKSVI